jgi:hypothetical protein
MIRPLKGGIAEEGADRRQAQITTTDAEAMMLLQILEKGQDQRGVEFLEHQLRGSLVSPVLANIYLHYELALWFERRFEKSCRGKAFLVRYRDDFIACFGHEDEAYRFPRELAERLAAFDLEVEPSKTSCCVSVRWRQGTANAMGYAVP